MYVGEASTVPFEALLTEDLDGTVDVMDVVWLVDYQRRVGQY